MQKVLRPTETSQLMRRNFRAESESAHILIVDDNPDELRLLIEILRGARFRISVAFDGLQGYQRAMAISPDLILMDVRMPRMDGLVACRLLKAQPAIATIPILLLSASGDTTKCLQTVQEGAADYLQKPYLAAEVLAWIHIHLRLTERQAAAAISVPPSSCKGTGDHARQADFARNASFCTTFREQFGVTPSQYRHNASPHFQKE